MLQGCKAAGEIIDFDDIHPTVLRLIEENVELYQSPSDHGLLSIGEMRRQEQANGTSRFIILGQIDRYRLELARWEYVVHEATGRLLSEIQRARWSDKPFLLGDDVHDELNYSDIESEPVLETVQAAISENEEIYNKTKVRIVSLQNTRRVDTVITRPSREQSHFIEGLAEVSPSAKIMVNVPVRYMAKQTVIPFIIDAEGDVRLQLGDGRYIEE